MSNSEGFPIKNIQEKTLVLRMNPKFPIALVGSVYLDEIIGPVHSTELAAAEWSGIEDIRFNLGGSTVWFGRNTFLLSKKPSHLFSIMADDKKNSLNRLFWEHLKMEQIEEGNQEFETQGKKWFYNHFTKISNSQSGVTVNIKVEEEESDPPFTTMYTLIGALSALTAKMIRKDLEKLLKDGGVIYFAGFFKTNLFSGLTSLLNNLPCENTIVCIDHGRMTRDHVTQNAIRILKTCFTKHLIDIYFCTVPELWSLDNATHRGKSFSKELLKSDNIMTDDEITTFISSLQLNLPPITILRDKHNLGTTKAYIIINESIIPVEVPPRNNSHVSDSAFNAAFVNSLTTINDEHQVKVNLYKMLCEQLKLNELKDLCFQMEQIDFEDLPGDNRKEKIRELVDKIFRDTKAQEDLMTNINEINKDFNWSSVYFSESDFIVFIKSACRFALKEWQIKPGYMTRFENE